MKIIEQSSDRLVVRHVPWFLGGFLTLMGVAALYAAIFKPETFTSTAEAVLVPVLGVGALAGAWWFAPVVTLTFDRSGGAVAFRETRLFRPGTRAFDYSKVERVQLQSHWSDGSRLTRLALRTSSGVVPLETGYTSADREPVMKAINAWLAGEKQEGPSPSREPTVRR